MALATATPILKAPDNYYFEKKAYVNDAPQISIVYHQSRASLRAAWKKQMLGKEPHPRLGAWTYMLGKNICIIHTIDPTVAYEPQLLGHEMMHCMHGNFHPTQE